MSEDVAADLPQFIVLTEKLIGQIVTHGDPLLPEDLREPAAKAWAEFNRKERRLPAEARDMPTVTLATVGLSGDQLGFKLATYNHVLKTFREKKDLNWLKKLLKVTDDILGSLVEVLTLAEPLKVMEENIGSAIDLLEGEALEGEGAKEFSLPEGFEF